MYTINYLTASLGHQDEVNTVNTVLRWHSILGNGAGFDEQMGYSLTTEHNTHIN